MKYLLLLLVVLCALSCEYDKRRQHRTDVLLNNINPAHPISVESPDAHDDVIPIAHPDQLHSHIVMDKTIKQYIDGNAYRRVLTYNYVDSVYQLYYMPIAVSVCLTYHDTVHMVYPTAIKPKE